MLHSISFDKKCRRCNQTTWIRVCSNNEYTQIERFDFGHKHNLWSFEGLIPRIDNELEGDEATRFVEEQRRLFFVGITRPKKELVLSSVRRIPKTLAYTMGMKVPWSFGPDANAVASSFLSQLGQDFPAPIAGELWSISSQKHLPRQHVTCCILVLTKK